jgi:magnesium transporter
MIKYYTNNAGGRGVCEIAEPQKNCWIHLESPAVEEVARVAALADLPEHFVTSALDVEETAHIDTEGNAKLYVLDIPTTIPNGDDKVDTISTMPVSLIITKDYIVSVTSKPTSVLLDFFNGKIRSADVAGKNRLVYQIMYNTASRYLYYLRRIDRQSDSIKKSLGKSMQNKELLQLVELQNSLVFFSASLSSNFAVIQKSAVAVKAGDESYELLEDVIIETKQAIEMCSVYREIIKSTMDAFAAVVNNNQNFVMRMLTAITIILSIPMVISGFWGMNTQVPFEGKLFGFWIAVAISFAISVVVAVLITRSRRR